MLLDRFCVTVPVYVPAGSELIRYRVAIAMLVIDPLSWSVCHGDVGAVHVTLLAASFVPPNRYRSDALAVVIPAVVTVVAAAAVPVPSVPVYAAGSSARLAGVPQLNSATTMAWSPFVPLVPLSDTDTFWAFVTLAALSL
jgi:hypothetical protein